MDLGYLDMTIERLIAIPDRGTVVVEFRGVRARCAAIERYRDLLEIAVEGDRVGVLLAGVRPSDLTATQTSGN